MRLILDITQISGGRYEGDLTVPGRAGRQTFAGVLELLAILEQQLQPGEPGATQPAGHCSGADDDGNTQ
jgi:hypothetical protein